VAAIPFDLNPKGQFNSPVAPSGNVRPPARLPLSIASTMIVFDLPTLLAVTVFISGLAGCLLLLSWLQHRRIFALALWGLAFIIAAIATVLIVVVRNTVPDFWSIVIGSAILAAAYGIIWTGVSNSRPNGFRSFSHWRER
jgi:hypothetical protein